VYPYSFFDGQYFWGPINLTTSHILDVCFTCEPPELLLAKYAPSFIFDYTSDVFMHMYTYLLFKLIGQTRGCHCFWTLVDKEYLIIHSPVLYESTEKVVS